MQKDKISIITIVLNDKNNIIKTMESVLCQTYKNIEYIIIDGKSNDGSKEIIQNKILDLCDEIKNVVKDNNSYIEAIKRDNPNFIIKFLSQKDAGIYYAMNKAIYFISGSWCNFMNSSDTFYNCDVIKNIFKNNFKNIAVIYGNTQMIYDSKNSKILYSSHNHKFHHKFIHQSSFINSKIIKKYKYDTNFKIAGDSDFFTKIYNKKHKFLYVDEIISSFNLSGISSKISYQMFKEDCKIGYKYNKFYPIFNTLKLLFRDIPRLFLRNILPDGIRNKIRVKFSKNKV